MITNSSNNVANIWKFQSIDNDSHSSINDIPSIQSMRQFEYLFNDNDNDNDNDNEDKEDARLRLLLRLMSKCQPCDIKIKINDWESVISSYVNDKMSDYDIYNNIRLQVHGNSISSSLSSISSLSNDVNNDTDRGNHLANVILDCIPNKLKANRDAIKTLLDYGCSEGAITTELARRLCLLPNQIYGADVRQCEANSFTFIKLSDEQDNKSILLPFADGSVDVIVASMVLHHVKNQDSLISEFKRILSANGVIIIREHDCNNSHFSVFLDIVHGLYSFVSTNIKWPGFISEAKMFYQSRAEWDHIFRKKGLKLISFESELSLQHYHYEKKTYKNSRYAKKNKPKITNMLRAYCAVYTNDIINDGIKRQKL